jgi:hypothetical protein
VAGSVALFLAGVDSIPAIKSIVDRIARKSSHPDEATLAKTAYRDEDGEATPESLKAFSDLWQRVAIAGFSGSGFLVTLALAVLTTLKYEADYLVLAWLQLGIWVCAVELGEKFDSHCIVNLIDTDSKFRPSFLFKLLRSSPSLVHRVDSSWVNLHSVVV